jgi:uncharacterized membrane protein
MSPKLLAVIAGVAALFVWVLRHPARGAVHGCCSGALDTLSQRYARGELTREQYEQMKRDIGD